MSSIVSLRNTLAGWADAINSAAESLPGDQMSLPDTRRLASALQAALNAFDAVKTAEEQTGLILADQNFTHKARVTQASQLREDAAKQADAALRTLKTIADGVYSQFAAAWKPKKPAGVESATLLDRKADVCALIESQAGDNPAQIVSVARGLLQEAKTAGDPDSLLTAYVIAGGPMDLWLRAKGVTPELAAKAFADVAGAAGANLEPLIGRGSGSLSGFIATAQEAIRESVEGLRQRLVPYIMSGTY